MTEFLDVNNATINNLKGVSAKIPKHSFTCLIGKSGSGKSSFAIDVLFRACIDGKVVDNSKENIVHGLIPAIAIKQRLDVDRHKCSVAKLIGATEYLSKRIKNSVHCHICDGSGTNQHPLPSRVIVNPELSLQKAVHPLLKPFISNIQLKLPASIKEVPFCQLSEIEKSHFFYGDRNNSEWRGLLGELHLSIASGLLELTEKEIHDAFFSQSTCENCSGLGLCAPQKEIGEALSEYALSFPLGETLAPYFFNDQVPLDQPVSHLSLGQLQWVRILVALQNTHPEMLVLFDEPAAGMCMEDALKLVDLFNILVKNRCTVVVIEHSLHVIRHADYILEFGPGGGSEGGEIVFSGPRDVFIKERLPFLNKNASDSPEPTFSAPKSFFVIKGIREYGLDKVELKLPDGMWTCIAGNISSGKTGLIDIINRAVDKSPGAWMGRIGLGEVTGRNKFRRPNIVDQKPIGLNPHSIPLTYIDGMTRLREVYSSASSLSGKELSLEYFSFNTKKGQCNKCKGYGCIEKDISGELYWIECPTCRGLRYSKDSLSVIYNNISIGEILKLTVSQAKQYLSDENTIVRKLEFLEKAGLGYLVIGQPSNTLSGGEAQRVKIARHLAKRLGDRTLYLLDTPSRGLSCLDVSFLVDVFRGLSKRNTVVIADNHPTFVNDCDWLIVFDRKSGVSKQVYAGPPQKAPVNVIKKITG